MLFLPSNKKINFISQQTYRFNMVVVSAEATNIDDCLATVVMTMFDACHNVGRWTQKLLLEPLQITVKSAH